MTPAERVEAVVDMGFTDRQAAFLVTVLLHGGVCLTRQYSAFTGITRGEKVYAFFGTLTSRHDARCYPRAHWQAHLYHVHAKRLYRAIGEVDSRYRRPVPIGRAIERLMVLDAVLVERRLRWLATESDKVEYFLRVTRLKDRELPRLVFGKRPAQTVRYFPDKLPIGIDSKTGVHVFVYLVNRDVPVDFRPFLHRHAELFRALDNWTLRLLVPPHLRKAVRLYQQAVSEELASPLRPAVADELRWYFHNRRRAEVNGASLVADARFERAEDAFAAPRFRALYRTWLKEGDDVLQATASPVLADALNARRGRVEPAHLAHKYQHLYSLVGTS